MLNEPDKKSFEKNERKVIGGNGCRLNAKKVGTFFFFRAVEKNFPPDFFIFLPLLFLHLGMCAGCSRVSCRKVAFCECFVC